MHINTSRDSANACLHLASMTHSSNELWAVIQLYDQGNWSSELMVTGHIRVLMLKGPVNLRVAWQEWYSLPTE